MWSGIPSVRSKTAAATSRGAGSPVSRISVVTRAVSAAVSGASRTSSAIRWRDEPRAPVPKARAGRDVLGPVVAGQEELPVARLSRQLRDDLEAHVVGPLQVLERQHRRARQRGEDPLDEPHHEPSTLDVLGRHGRIAQVEQLPAERRRTARAGSSTAPGRGSRPPARRGPAGRPPRRPRRSRGPPPCAGWRRAAGSCRSRPRRRAGGTGPGRRRRRRAADPRGRAGRRARRGAGNGRLSARCAWPRSVGRGASRVIGHSTDDPSGVADRRCVSDAPTRMVEAPGTGGGHGELHGRPLGLLRRHRRAAEGGPRARPGDRGATRACISSAPGSIPSRARSSASSSGPSRESVMRIHERAGHPTAEIYELQVEV